MYISNTPAYPSQNQVYNGIMPDVFITAGIVREVLQGLNVNSAVGLDNILPRAQSVFAHQLSMSLTLIFNKSMRTGMLPSSWLESVVVPLFKAESRYDPMNYRPVSLTSVCCKTMERLVAADLMQYLELNGLLSDRQFGVCKSRSTEEQMLLVYLKIASQWDGC